jgi:hypothetical protein
MIRMGCGAGGLVRGKWFDSLYKTFTKSWA